MKEYDQISDWYLSARDQETGVNSVKAAFMDLKPGSTIIDLGCGTGLPLARTLQQMDLKVVGIDSSKTMIDSFRVNLPNTQVIHARLQDYVFPESIVKGVVCWGCLFHLTPDDQTKVLGNVFNSVAVGGKFLFSSAKQAGCKMGEMNGISFKYHSLGSAKYNELAENSGWKLVHESEDEKRNYEYLFERI